LRDAALDGSAMGRQRPGRSRVLGRNVLWRHRGRHGIDGGHGMDQMGEWKA
jgi:hypothetical protein